MLLTVSAIVSSPLQDSLARPVQYHNFRVGARGGRRTKDESSRLSVMLSAGASTQLFCHPERSEGSKMPGMLNFQGEGCFRFFTPFRMTDYLCATLQTRAAPLYPSDYRLPTTNHRLPPSFVLRPSSFVSLQLRLLFACVILTFARRWARNLGREAAPLV
jgi:hypothetical protein